MTTLHRKVLAPPPWCPQHPGGTDQPCHACRQAWAIAEAWEHERAARLYQQRAAFYAEVDACPDCDEHGWIDPEDDDHPIRIIRCPHHDWGRPRLRLL